MTRAGGFATWPPRDASVSAVTLAREFAALARVTMAPPPFPNDAARGNGQPVIVIPGFLAPDMSTARLREFLARQGFAPTSWACGVNLGPMPKVLALLERQVKDAADAAGRPVSLRESWRHNGTRNGQAVP
jgi:sirohydrochlorin ferrochelatase